MSKYVVFDLEMCKIPKHIKTENLHMEIIEIGAVLLDEAYKEVDSFKTYIKPEYGFVDNFIEKLTGITMAEKKMHLKQNRHLIRRKSSSRNLR